MARAGRRVVHRIAMLAGGACGVLLAALVFFRLEWRGGAPALVPRFDLGRWVELLPTHTRWVVPFALLTASLAAWRSSQWRIVLGGGARFRDAYHATALGGLIHNTLPGKLGPFASAWLLARWARRPFGEAVSSQLLAKLLELGAIVAATGAAALAVRGSATRLPVIAGSGALLFALLAVAVVVAARHAPGFGVRVGRRLPRVGAFVEALGSGLGAASDPRRLLLAGAAGFAPALTSALAYGLALRSFGVGAGLVGGAVILGVVTLGQFTPGLPVGTGVYWFLCSWAARQLGAPADDAAALAALSHASTVAAHLVVGSSSALFRRRDLAALLRERRAGAAARRAAAAIADARQPARESV